MEQPIRNLKRKKEDRKILLIFFPTLQINHHTLLVSFTEYSQLPIWYNLLSLPFGNLGNSIIIMAAAKLPRHSRPRNEQMRKCFLTVHTNNLVNHLSLPFFALTQQEPFFFIN